MYINLHDGIDFDGFNNITFGKKIFFDSHFHLFSLNIIGIFLLIGNAYKFFNIIYSKDTMPINQLGNSSGQKSQSFCL